MLSVLPGIPPDPLDSCAFLCSVYHECTNGGWYIGMATFQRRGSVWRAIVRRKGHAPQSKSFPTKALAKVWADRIALELAEADARGVRDAGLTIAELVDWYRRDVGKMKRVSKTQTGNLTRLREGLGQVVASRLSVADIVEHVRRRRAGDHLDGRGVRIPACGPATMTVEVSYLAELMRLAKSMGKVQVERDVVAEARPALRLVKLVSRGRKRDRRPTADELARLRAHFEAAAWRAKIPMGDVIDFALATARRQSEITRLLWADVDEARRTCVLRDAKHPRAKLGNHRTFPLLGEAWTIVQRQPRTDARIFPYQPKSICTAFVRACHILRIDDLHFHDLRHEATSRLFEAGYSIEQVAAVTLHETWGELKRYTQLRPESLHRDG